jgi:hypothetical protein
MNPNVSPIVLAICAVILTVIAVFWAFGAIPA